VLHAAVIFNECADQLTVRTAHGIQQHSLATAHHQMQYQRISRRLAVTYIGSDFESFESQNDLLNLSEN
jgi:hypothetical protein